MKSLNGLHRSPRKLALGALTLVGLLLAGCVVTSIYPYYTAKDVVFEPKLVGRWVESDKPGKTNELWEFTRAGTNDAYTLTIPDGEKRTEFQAHLFRLKGFMFLDALPAKEHDDFVPPHYLLKVIQFEPTLKLAALDYKWMRNRLEAQPRALRHLPVEEDHFVITADTAELQKFILKHAANTNAFPGSFDFARQP